MDILKHVRDFRTKFVRNEPFLGSLAMGLDIKEYNFSDDPSTQTMATTGKEIWVHPNYPEKDLPYVEPIYLHEICHVICRHPGKSREWAHKVDKNIFTLACEFEVNHWVKDIFEKDIPPNAYYDPKYNGSEWGTMQVYMDLLNRPDLQNLLAGLGTLVLDDHTQWDKYEGLSEQEVKQMLAAAAQNAKRRGKLPAGLERLIDDLLDSKIPWTHVVAPFLSDLAKDDYSYRHPNKRYIPDDLYLPSLYSRKLKIGVGFDSSGSITDEMFKEYLSELREILVSFPSIEPHFMCCDAEVYKDSYRMIESIDEISELQFKGGGGTDFKPVFKFIEENQLDISVLLYFTDTYGDFPEHPPEYPVLWVVNSPGEVPWGERIQL